MKRYQDKILEMLKRISAFYKKNKDALATLVVLSSLYDQIDEKIALAEKLKLLQNNTSVGSTSQKNAYRRTTMEKALEIISGLVGYARALSNFVLLAEINMAETYLRNLGDNEFKDKMEIVHQNVLKYADEIVDYGISPRKVTAFREALDVFSAAIGTPKGIVIEHKGVTNQVSSVVDEAMEVVKIIDPVMNTLRFSNSVLYSEYQRNRQIDSSVRSFSARVQVDDAGKSGGIEGARVVFELDGETVLDKLTAAKGGINIKTLSEGAYNVTVTKIGYEPESVTFIVSDTESSYLEVKLRKKG